MEAATMFDEKRFNSDDYEYRQACYKNWIAEKKELAEKANNPATKKECLYWAELYTKQAQREKELYLIGGEDNE
jgi:hypothetical protein